MKNKDFIDTVVGFYNTSRKAVEKYQSSTIKRGRNHSVSSLTEDLLAYFIVERCKLKDFELWIDYPITYYHPTKKTKNGNIAKTVLYPDISIVKVKQDAYEIVNMIDLKMDLGWKREFDDYLDKIFIKIEHIKLLGTATYKKLDNNKKSLTSSPVSISKKLVWRVVVMSNQNIGTAKMDVNISYAKNKKFTNKLKMYVFSTNVHPNNGYPTISNESIDEFINDVCLLKTLK